MGGQTAVYSPFHRVMGRIPSADGGFPYDASPSLDFAGSGLQDHRLRYNAANSSTGFGVLGWYGDNPVFALNITPAAAGNTTIAAAANVTSGTAMTLVSSTGGGVTVLAASTVFWPALTTLSTGLVLGSVPAPLAFGRIFRSGFYDRTKMDGRAVSVTGSASATGGNVTIAGYDVYGYAMSEVIAAPAGATTVNGKKAFKVISSVTPAFTDAHNYSVGTLDIFGLPIRTSIWGDAVVHYNSALLPAATGFVAADTTSPATTTTGDVRGTYAVQSATDGTKTLQVKIHPGLTAISTNFSTGLFGVLQA